MARWFLLSCFVGLFCCLGGCGTNVQPVPVRGEVVLDGQPLKEGEIRLAGLDGSTPDRFEVKDGKFEGQSKPGKKRVEIFAFQPGKTTKMGNKTMEATRENYLPAKYNNNSKITAEVGSSGLEPAKFFVMKE